MTENQLEETFSKARSINLKPAFHSPISDIPGSISIWFDNDVIYDAIEMYQYIQTELTYCHKSVYIEQTGSDEIALTLLIDKEPPIILRVTGLLCKQEKIEYFLKKQPKEGQLSLQFIHNMKPTTLDETAALLQATNEANFNQPIQIHLWYGKPLGTSSGEETNFS